jgi:hypothetical protein
MMFYLAGKAMQIAMEGIDATSTCLLLKELGKGAVGYCCIEAATNVIS